VCRSDQVRTIEGKCELDPEASANDWTYNGKRKVAVAPLVGERCNVFENAEFKRNGTIPLQFFELAKTNKVVYVSADVEFEECSVYDDLKKSSPFVKFMSMLVAIFTVVFFLCGLVICCNYCNLD